MRRKKRGRKRKGERRERGGDDAADVHISDALRKLGSGIALVDSHLSNRLRQQLARQPPSRTCVLVLQVPQCARLAHHRSEIGQLHLACCSSELRDEGEEHRVGTK